MTATSPTLTFSGVGSGTDWTTIIGEMVTAAKTPATLLTQQKTDLTTQLSLVGNFVSSLGSLAASGTSLLTSGGLFGTAAGSSDATTVKATSLGNGTVGSYNVKVNQLAQGETRQSTGLSTGGAGAAGAGTLHIAVGTGAGIDVPYTTTDVLSDIAARITGSVPGVTAIAVYDGTSYHLALSSQATGKANGMSITDTGSMLGLDSSGSITQAAKDSSVSVNGVTATESSNHITDLVPGAVLDLQGLTPSGGASTLISVSQDPSSVVGKVQSLVTAYNSVAALLATQTTYTGTNQGQDTLFGDPMVSRLKQSLGTIIAGSFSHGTGNLTAADVGITINTDGSLALDTNKLSSKLASDPTAITDVFTGANGLGKQIATLANQSTSVDGPFALRQQTLKDTMKRFDTQIAEINGRGDQLQTRLQKQFASLDAQMAAYTTNSSYLSSLSTTKG